VFFLDFWLVRRFVIRQFSHVLSILHVGDSFVRRAVTLSQHAAFPIGGCDLEKEGPDGIYVSSFVEALFSDNT
jgi:hypothetical protein